MTIRIVISAMPALLDQIVVHALSREPDMVVVARHVASPDLAEAIRRHDADVVIVRQTSPLSCRAHERLLHSRPHVSVLAISGSGRDAMLCELKPARSTLPNVSPSELVAAIRRAAHEESV